MNYEQRRIKSLENKVKSQIDLLFELGEELNKCHEEIQSLRTQLRCLKTKSPTSKSVGGKRNE